MRDVDHEVLANALQLFKLGVLSFQTIEHELQLLAGLIQFGRKNPEFTPARVVQPRPEVAFGKLARVFDNGAEPARDVP